MVEHHSLFIRIFMEGQFGIGLIINALLYVPQVIRVYKAKDSKELSLIMFIGFWFLTMSQCIYGFYVKDWIMGWGNILTLITCGAIVWFILYYRNK